MEQFIPQSYNARLPANTGRHHCMAHILHLGHILKIFFPHKHNKSLLFKWKPRLWRTVKRSAHALQLVLHAYTHPHLEGTTSQNVENTVIGIDSVCVTRIINSGAFKIIEGPKDYLDPEANGEPVGRTEFCAKCFQGLASLTRQVAVWCTSRNSWLAMMKSPK